MDAVLFKYFMGRYGDTLQTLADALNIHKTTLSGKINGRDEFKQGEMTVIIDRYNLTPDETMNVFFSDVKVAN